MKEEIIEISVSDIKPNKFFKRSYDKEKIKEMTESIREHGIINIPEVDEDNVLIDGRLRCKGAKLARLEKIKVKKVSGLDGFEKRCRCFIGNNQRQDVPYVEKVEEVKELLKYFKSFCKRKGSRGPVPVQKELAKALGISEQWLSQILKFDDEAPADIKKLVEKGKVSETRVISTLSLPPVDREVEFEELRIEAGIRTPRLATGQTTGTTESLLDKVKIWVASVKHFFNINKVSSLSKEEAVKIKKELDETVIPLYNELVKKVE